jgi:hypothetical protein
MGFDVNDKKMYKQLKSIKNISKKIEKLDINNKDVEKIFVKWEGEFNNKIRFVTGNIKVKELFSISETYGRFKNYEYFNTFIDSGSYKGNKESVIDQFQQEMKEKYNRVEPSPS